MKNLKDIFMTRRSKRETLKKSSLGATRSVWFIVRIIIYLLVTYSIIFTISVTVAGFWAKNQVDNFLNSVKELEYKNPSSTNYMKQFTKKKALENSNFKVIQNFIPLDSISPYLIKAVIAVEDASFYNHPGINIESILSAIQTNKERGKKAFGGSTLTQQMAKNLFLTNEKSYQRKIKEIIYALLMEKYLGKDRILELYLNYAQWGESIFGCEAAAQKYYKKSAHNLTFNESVRMASVLANPVKYTPLWRNSKFLAQRRRVIFENLYITHDISLEVFQKMTGAKPRTVRDSLYRLEVRSVESDSLADTLLVAE